MKKNFYKVIALALVVLLLPISAFARTYTITEGPYLEDDGIAGYTQSYKDVTLYRGERHTLRNEPDRSVRIATATSDKDGFFKIPFKYERALPGDYKSLDFSYSNREITATTTSPNTYYIIYDRYNNQIGQGRSDRSGRILFDTERRYDKNDLTIVEYKDTEIITDLEDYYIIVSDRYGQSQKHYLTGMNVSQRLPNSSDEPVRPTINTIRGGDEILRGYGTNSNAMVIAYDQKDEIIGRTKANLNGVFKIDLFRAVRSGEKLRVEVITYTTKTLSTDVYVEYDINQFNYKNTFTIDSKNYVQILNGERTDKKMDIAPYIKNGRTMLPLRFVGESLGYDVSYERLKHHAVLTNKETTIQVDLNSNVYTVDGREFKFNVKPELVNDRTMLPITEIALALDLTHGNIGEGRNIEWDAANRQVIIQVNK